MARLTKAQLEALEKAEDVVSRAKEKSKQPRFRGDNKSFYSSIYNWVTLANVEEIAYKPDSRERDAWLRQFWKLEPHLAGVISSVTSVDKNRKWSLIGGRNQVMRYVNILHNFQAAPNVRGWRSGISSGSLAYYTSDLGFVSEIGRDGKEGPMRAMYFVDPSRCRLTGAVDYPLSYYAGGEEIGFAESDYFRVASMLSTDEKYNGLGYCALSRCLELAKIMVAIYEYDQERLGARAPKGILLLNGITEIQWEDSLKAREAKLDSLERKYYSGVQVLASTGIDNIDAKLVALSQMPEGFDMRTFTDLLMYGYALCFNYDPREFYPVSGGQLGTATETETQHMKATGKGGLDFILSLQEQIQGELPETLQFEFEQRDAVGELRDAEVDRAKVDVIKAMYEAGMTQEGIIDRSEARTLLAEQGIIPEEWTEQEEDVTVDDTDPSEMDRLFESPRIRMAMEAFDDEPIVRYTYPDGTFRELVKPARIWSVVRRQDTSKVLYEDTGADVTITEADEEQAIEKARRRVGDELYGMLNAKIE